MAGDTLYLRHHLVNWLFTPLYLLFLFSMITGYIAATKLSNEAFDKILIERARFLAQRYDQGEFHGNAMEKDTAPVHFALFDRDGRALFATAPLPPPRPQDIASREPTRRDAYLHSSKIRLVTLHQRLPRNGLDCMVQIAEPIDARQVLMRNVLGNIVVPQFLFIVIAGASVWIGLRNGLAPLERLRQRLSTRSREDLSPLDQSLAPGEIQPFVGEINRLLERLKTAMESQRQFVANAAHQLRTPFAGLVSQAELAKREPLPQATRDALEGICDGAKRCARLVNQLLALSRNSPDAVLEETRFSLDLCQMGRSCAARWVPEALKQGVDLGYEGEDQGILVLAQESALTDLIDNLLDNAIHYTPAGGHVTLRVRREPNRSVWLQVEDDGCGIPAALRDKVFQRFYRISSTRHPGSGLGLAIVREAALRLNASVNLQDNPRGQGTLFTVTFPPPYWLAAAPQSETQNQS